MTNLRKALEKKRIKIKDPSLHFRPECEGFRCGAHKSFDEGFDAATNLLLPLIEELRMALEKSADPLQFVPKDVLWELQRRQLIAKEALSKLEEFERQVNG